MPVLINKGQTINGIAVPAGFVVFGLDKDDEDKLTQGGAGNQVNLAVLGGSAAAAVEGMVSGAGLSRLAPRIVCALQGDSHAGENGPIQFSATQINYPEVGWFNWLQVFSGQAYDLMANYGITGQLTAQILARNAAQVQAARALGVTDVFCCGGANDVNDAGYDFAATTSNMAQIYAQWAAAGIVVHILTVFPQYAQSAARGGNIHRLRVWQLQHAAQYGYLVHDSWLTLIDPLSATGAAKQYYLRTDNLHPSAKGARAIGQAIHTQCADRHALVAPYHASSLIDQVANDAGAANKVLTPLVNGAVTSGVAANFQVVNASGTATLAPAVNARSDGFGNDQAVVISAAIAGNSVQVRTNDTTYQRLAVNQAYDAEVYVSVASATNVKRTTFRFNVGVDATTYLVEFLSSSNLTANEVDQSDWSGWLRAPRFLVPAGGAVTSANLNVFQDFAGAGGATLSAGRWSAVPRTYN